MSLIADFERQRTANPDLPMSGLPASTQRPLAKHGEFTAAEFLREAPEDYRSCCRLFGEGVSIREMSRVFGRSQNTIRAALRAEGLLSVDALRGRIRDRALAASLALVERVEEDPDKVPMASLAMTLGVLVDKAQVLDGQPTAIVERRDTLDVDAYAKWLKEVRETGLGAENVAANGPGIVIDVEELPAESAPDGGSVPPPKALMLNELRDLGTGDPTRNAAEALLPVTLPGVVATQGGRGSTPGGG